ncbi:MAG TPA: hypothetical protein VEA59_04510 [Patescibacteria group bacterium]|nr:hypothetical protein [Patescibacteria group bacterium]
MEQNQLQLQPLFDYLDEKFTDIDGKFKKIETDIGEVKTTVANLAGQVYAFQQEMTINTMKAIRMEHWIIEASKKIGIPYNV